MTLELVTSGVTSLAANRSPAFSVPLSPNKANGERVRNGCKSSDITPLLSTASAVSVAAALNQKTKKNIRTEKGEGGHFASSHTSVKTPRKKEKKELIVWSFALSKKKRITQRVPVFSACSVIHLLPPDSPLPHWLCAAAGPRVGPVFLKYSFAWLSQLRIVDDND